MILYPVVDNRAKVNRLHIMLGPESDEYFMLFGTQAFNMSEIQKEVFNNNNLPTHVILTKVVSEMSAAMLVNKMMMQSHIMNQVSEQNKTQVNTNDLKNGVWIPDLICPKCLQKGVYLKQGEQALCKDCLKIEKGLGSPEKEKKKKKGAINEDQNPEGSSK